MKQVTSTQVDKYSIVEWISLLIKKCLIEFKCLCLVRGVDDHGVELFKGTESETPPYGV
jgi:hypothetical protein